MEERSTIRRVLENSVLGLIITWGGFNTILPNILEAAGQIFELGSYKALRTFSIAYFLTPVFLFITYWVFIGHKQLNKAIKGTVFLNKNLQNKKFIKFLPFSFTLFNLYPVCVFFNSEYVVPLIFSDYIDLTIYYFIITSIYLFFFLLYENNKLEVQVLTIIVLSLNLLFSWGIILNIEPWAIYNENLQLSIGISIILYIVFSFILLLNSFLNRNSLKVKKIRDLIDFFPTPVIKKIIFLFYYYLGFSFLGVVFPVVNFNHWYSIVVIFVVVLIGVTFFIRIFYFKIKNQEINGFNVIFTFIIFGFIAIVSVYIPFKNLLEKTNQLYLYNRIQAISEFSDKAILPYFHFNSKNNTDQIIDIKINLLKQLYFKNHEYSTLIGVSNNSFKELKIKKGNFEILKLDRALCRYSAQKDSVWINIDRLRELNNVKKILFKPYVENNLNQKEILELSKKFKETNQEYFFSELQSKINQEKLNLFYQNVYQYISDSLIDVYYLNLKESEVKKKFPLIKNYFHPINYYSENLRYYKERFNEAQSLQTLIFELNTYESLYKPEVNNIFGDYFAKRKENLLKEKIDEILKKSIQLNLLNEINPDPLKILNRENFLNYYLIFKHLQYRQRYEKSQLIFRAYLSDSQRVGIYVFIFLLVSLFFIYALVFHFPEEKSGGRKILVSFLIFPREFINVTILVVTLLLVSISRPIKPENINPEKPYWMMDLSNWYKPIAIRPLIISKKEGNGKESIIKIDRIDMDTTNELLKNIKEQLLDTKKEFHENLRQNQKKIIQEIR